MDDFLPLSYLNAWAYCPRRFYWEYVLGEMEDSADIIIGRHLHRNINEEELVWEGDTLIRKQQWVWSDRLRVKGIIDAVEDTEGKLVPLEYKKGKMSKYKNDHYQLCAAAICLEEQLGRNIPYGEIFYHTNRRRERVEFSDSLRKSTENAIALAHQAVDQAMPSPIDHPRKCLDCSLLKICLPKEIQYLRTLALNNSPILEE